MTPCQQQHIDAATANLAELFGDARPLWLGYESRVKDILAAMIEAIPGVSKPPADLAATIYAAYPRKVAKHAAIAAIERAMREVSGKTLLATVQAYAAAVATWKEEDRAFIPHPATWFNRGSYFDDAKEWQAKGKYQSSNWASGA